jgi:hypothetical protein
MQTTSGQMQALAGELTLQSLGSGSDHDGRSHLEDGRSGFLQELANRAEEPGSCQGKALGTGKRLDLSLLTGV